MVLCIIFDFWWHSVMLVFYFGFKGEICGLGLVAAGRLPYG